MSAPFAEFAAVRLRRGEREVLAIPALTLRERRIGVIGANGSGKSSFARLLNGLLAPTAGTVRIFGIDTASDPKAVRRRVGFLFQNPDNQIVYPTVGEDVAFGLQVRGVAKREAVERIARALTESGLAGFEDRRIHELSGGERQLVALAGILVAEPDLLVLDEPTALLDLANTRRLMGRIERFSGSAVTVTHDLSLLEHQDRVLVFAGGTVTFDGRPSAAIDRYRASVA